MGKRDKKKSSFRGRVNEDAKRQSSGSGYGYLNLPKGMPIYNPEAGNKDNFDILPYKVTTDKHPDLNEGYPSEDDLWYKRPFKVHKDVGVDKKAFVCLTSFGKKCPICDYKKRQADNGVEWEELKAYAPKERVLYAIYPVEIEKAKDQVHILDISWWLFQKEMNEELNENEDYEVFPELEDGLTLKVRWVKGALSTKKNSYAEAGRIDFIEREDSLPEDISDDIPALDDLLQELTYKELEVKFFEMEDVDEDEKKSSKNKDENPFDKKRNKKKKDKVELDWDDLTDMDATELWDVVEAKELDIDEDDYESAKELCKLVAKELDIDIPKKKKEKEETKKPERKAKKDKEKCPEGFKYGVDTDDNDECDDCDLWDACSEKKENK